MGQIFRSVRNGISWRLLSNHLHKYHVITNFAEGDRHRADLWEIDISNAGWQEGFIGSRYWVESSTDRIRSYERTFAAGKAAVREFVLSYAAEKLRTLGRFPGFERLGSFTMSHKMNTLKRVRRYSVDIEQAPRPEIALEVLDGTRCPDCSESICSVNCPSFQ